jgi:hypothetical protein
METGLYQHYSGSLYHVIGISRHTETLEAYVVYQALYGNFGLWIRPLAMFQEEVTIDNKLVPRFKFLRPLFDQPPTLR